MSSAILDASALLALINQESGATAVAETLPIALIGAVNFSEVAAKLITQGLPEDEIREIFSDLHLPVIPFDEQQALRTGLLRVKTKQFGLSLGDRACLALGLEMQCPVLTADRAWAELDIDVEIQVIR
ncbi:MAG: type II toxin-antitoxin system VapC family toxin [Leptolyngbya sp. SIO1E4]|nr:type II toxin-antitoxin system VapC family toxin [Leptolyngbya sp. SIO1E4]